MADNIDTTKDRAKVVLFPPLVGLALFITGVVLQLISPLTLFSSEWLAIIVGLPVLVLGIALQAVCVRTLKSAKTTPLFKKPTTQILQKGPYGKSRNPIYVAVMIQFLGLSLVVNSIWLIFIIPVLFLYLNYGVIAFEEQYLQRKFGKEYSSYKKNVPRWI